MDLILLGCCGAYCKTCPVYKDKKCIGCKVGYGNCERDIKKAKCKIKICCIKKGFDSCAECGNIDSCVFINQFYEKNGYKYKKYKEAILFINKHGYHEFFKIANTWKNQYGSYV